jgi:hypothetical protein
MQMTMKDASTIRAGIADWANKMSGALMRVPMFEVYIPFKTTITMAA